MNGHDKRRPSDSDSPDEDSFRVEDRRRFDPDTAERRSDDAELPGGGVLHASSDPADLPPVDFGDVVRPFLMMGLTGLGVVPHPDAEGPRIDLPLAQRAIDTLELIKQKTEGSRDSDETKMVEEALFELKMQFVHAQESRQ